MILVTTNVDYYVMYLHIPEQDDYVLSIDIIVDPPKLTGGGIVPHFRFWVTGHYPIYLLH